MKLKSGEKRKPLPPTARGKKRYIVFRLAGGEELSQKQVHHAIWKAMLELYGSAGTAKQRTQLIEFEKGRGIVRCDRGHTEEIKAGLLFVENVDGTKVVPKTVKTSGTLKKLRGHASRR